jgi:uncharacterized protein YrrD
MNSRDVMAKPVVAIRPGRIIGKVRYPIIDASKQEVIGFIIDDEKWFLETKVILLPLVRGMGKDVMTVEDEAAMMSVPNLKAIQKQLEENIQLIGHKVITETGRVLGYIEEFSFNPTSGKIDSYKVKGANSLVSCKDTISIGKELLITKEQVSSFMELTKELPQVEDDYNLNSIFEKRQMEFVLGKRLLRRLETEDGSIIASEGHVVDEAVIRKAKRQGKFTELVMSIEPDLNL